MEIYEKIIWLSRTKGELGTLIDTYIQNWANETGHEAKAIERLKEWKHRRPELFKQQPPPN